MHQPGYIQEGQEAIFGDLLLGIYHGRIPGDTLIKLTCWPRGTAGIEVFLCICLTVELRSSVYTAVPTTPEATTSNGQRRPSFLYSLLSLKSAEELERHPLCS